MQLRRAHLLHLLLLLGCCCVATTRAAREPQDSAFIRLSDAQQEARELEAAAAAADDGMDGPIGALRWRRALRQLPAEGRCSSACILSDTPPCLLSLAHALVTMQSTASPRRSGRSW